MKIIFQTNVVGIRQGKKPIKKTIFVDEVEFESHVFGLVRALPTIRSWNGKNALEVHPQAVSIQKFLKKNKKAIINFALMNGEEIYIKALSDMELICKKTYCYQGAFIVIES